MRLHMLGRLGLGLTLLAALLLAGCGTGEDKNEEGVSSPVPSPEPTVVANTIVAQTDIQEVDFSQTPQGQDLVAGGGEILPGTVIYADLTGDGQEEAVVPVSSGGTGGDIGFAVFTERNGTLEELLASTPGRVMVEVDEGVLVETQPIYGPDDPNCCPSQLKKIYYRWDGDALVVDHEETIDQPQKR
jgi:hypothetical protein